MAKMVSAKTYSQNVLKSAGYIAAETIKGVNPTLTSYISDTSNATKDMYRSVKDYKNTIRNKINHTIGLKAFEDLKSVKRNAIDDLRTGKFYNPERESSQLNAFMKSQGIEFNFDDMNFDVDEEDVNSESAVSDKSIENLGDRITASQQQITGISTAKILLGARSNTKASMEHNEILFGTINNSLSVVNSSIMNLHQDIARPLNTHIINSTNFYQVATNELAKQTNYLENINNIIMNRFDDRRNQGFGSNSRKRTNYEEIFMNGIPDFRKWGNLAKNRAISRSGIDSILGMINPEMMELFFGSGALSSPIALATTMAITSRIQNGPTGKALDRTVDSLKGGFTQMGANISRYRKNGKSPFLKTLASLFDLVPDRNAKIDFSKYNKGRVDWTGKDSKALQEVIPTQLATIISAITGREPKIFDYNTGKWTTARAISSDFKESRIRNIGNASRELRNDVVKGFISDDRLDNPDKPGYTHNSRATRSLVKDYDRLMYLLTLSGTDISSFRNANEFKSYVRSKGWVIGRSSTGNTLIDAKNLDIIAKQIFKKAGSRSRLTGSIYAGRIADSNFVAGSNEGSFGTISNGSGLLAANGNSIVGRIFDVTDDKGNNIFFYLQDFYSQLRTIANNTGNGKYRNSKENRYQNRGSSILSTAVPDNNRYLTIHNRFGYSDNLTDDPEGRYEFNSRTGEYEPPMASSRASREEAEKSSPISRGIDKFNSFIDKIFYGDIGDTIKAKIKSEGGLFGFIRNLPDIISESVSLGIYKTKEFFKNKWDQFKESDFGQDFFGTMKNSAKGFARNTWSYTKDKTARGYEYFFGKKHNWAADVTGAYKGGYVRKSGMASVSEGEMIIPAKYNPYYTGNMSDSARKSVERKNYKNWLADGGDKDKFFGFFKDGTTHVGRWVKLSNKEKNIIKQLASEGYSAEEIAKKIKKPIGQVSQVISSYNINETAHIASENVKEKVNSFRESDISKKIHNIANKGYDLFDKGLELLIGDPDKYKNGKEVAKEALNTAKSNLPKTMASGALGGIIGAAATGSAFGLLGGFTIGAGSYIIKNSEYISKKLFGEYDPASKEWRNGKLPSKATKFIKERLPDVAKGGALGGVLGTLGLAPGGIFGGMVLGAGIELVSTTNTFKNIMFGHEDVHGNRNGGIMGSIKINVVDPLVNFVHGGISKIGKYVRDNFLNPLTKIFDPVKDWIKGKSKRVLDNIANAAKEVVKRTIGERFNALFKPLAEKVGSVGKFALKTAGKVASAPFKLVGKLGEGLERHNIRRGYSSKSASERMSMEGTKLGLFGRKVKNTGYTKWASTATDEDIQYAQHYMNGAISFKRSKIKKRQDLANLVTASLVDGGNSAPGIVKQLKKLFNTDKVVKYNDFSEVISAVENLDPSLMGEETKAKVIEAIENSQASIAKDIKNHSTFSTDRKEFFNRIGLTDKKSINKFIKEGRIQSQLDANGIKKKLGLDLESVLTEAKNIDNESKLLKEQEEVNPIDRQRNGFLERILGYVSGIACHIGVKEREISKYKTSSNKIETRILPSKNNFDKPKEAEDGERKTVFDANGNTIEYVYKNGEWTKDLSDASTNETTREADEDRQMKNKFFGMFVNGGILASLKNLLNPTVESDKKPTLWEKIKDGLGGLFKEDGIVGKLFGGSGIFGKILGALGSIVSIVGALGPIITAAAGLTILGNLGTRSAGTSTDSGMYKGADPEARKEEVESWKGISGFFKKASLGVNSLENIIRGRDTTTYDQDDYVSEYETSRYGKRLISNALMSGNKRLAQSGNSIISKTLGKIPIVGKYISAPLKAASNISKAPGILKKMTSNVTSKLLDIATDPAKKGKTTQKVATKTLELASKLKPKIRNILSVVTKKLKISNKIVSAADDIATKIASTVSLKLGKNASKFIPVVGQVLYIAEITNAVLEAIQSAKAKSILGIVDEPTTAQKALAAICNGINYAIPGIGGIIPTETIFDIVYTALKAVGVKFGNLEEQRAKAKSDVKNYNEANGTTYNIEEYIHNALGEYTIQDKLKSGIKKLFKGGSAGIKNPTYKGWIGTGTDIHTEQKGNYRRFGNSTIDENGCGPAAASTVLKSYGKNIGINDAAAYAESGGYVAGSSGVGTRASYFGDILGSNGIKTSYTDNKSKINSSIESGRPTILLGQDSSNNSKSNSPFGPNPHYVVARGTDANGNIYVDDPELKGTAIYKRNILNKTKLGVLTGGASDAGELINTALSGVFKSAADKVGVDSSDGKVLSFITNGFGAQNEQSEDTSTEYSSDGTMYVYGGTYNPRKKLPKENDQAYKYYFSNINPFVAAGYGLPNCTCYAFGRFYEILGSKPRLSTGNAEDWYGHIGDGYTRNSRTPMLGAVICWADGPYSGYGHVGIVEKIVSSKHIKISHSGYKSFMFRYGDCYWDEKTKQWYLLGLKSKYRWQGFIYNPAIESTLSTAGNRKTSKRGVDLIAKFEGFRANAYKAVPSEKHYTIGYGHYGPDVQPTDRISKENAKNLLARDISRFEKNVNDSKYVPFTNQLNQNQFDALVSFAYNLGPGTLPKLTANGIDQVPINMQKYVNAGGKKLNGLVRRRKEEAALFNEPGGFSGLNNNIIIPKYDFTNQKYNRYTNSYGSASSISTPRVSTKSSTKVSDNKVDQIILYIKQIATNTGYNSAIPTLVDVTSNLLDLISGLNGNSTRSSSTNSKSYSNSASMDNEISLMKAKLEAIAQTL